MTRIVIPPHVSAAMDRLQGAYDEMVPVAKPTPTRSDDLIARLRDEHLRMSRNEAADRIAALEAELAAAKAGRVTVKSLSWFEVEKSRYGGKYTADGYTIRYIESLWLLDFAGSSKTVWHFPTLEAAKAAAQADYEARILSALTPTPAADPVAEAARELTDYVLQADLHNRLTPRVVDIAFYAWQQGRSGKNADDGGPCDWFCDTRPMVMQEIEKIRTALRAITEASHAAD